jgi:hypothetical protein
VSRLAAAGSTARLEVWLQGVSDLPASPDHHLRVYLNGALVEESSAEGKLPLKSRPRFPRLYCVKERTLWRLRTSAIPAPPYSMVMLDRFAVTYPREGAAERGRLEGRWERSGSAEVTGVGPDAVVSIEVGTRLRWE